MAIRLSKNFINNRNRATCGLNMPIIKLLLEKGADPNLCSGDTGDFYSHCPPLFIAAVINHAPLCEMLLDFGANINATERRGYNALQSSLSLKNTKVTELLIKRGIDANIRTGDGFTPLHLACYNGDMDAVEAMLELSEGRTDVLVKDGFGRSVVEHAQQSRNKALIKYLEAAIAKAKSGGGSAGAAAAPPAAADAVVYEGDPATWNVARLKAFLKEKGVSFEGMTEKQELITAVRMPAQKLD